MNIDYDFILRKMTRPIILVAFILTILLILVGVELSKVVEFRKKQDFAFFEENFSNSGVHNWMARYLILKSGSKSYDNQVKFLLKRVKPVEDLYNVSIYNKIYESMPEEEFFDKFDEYPFDVNKIPEKTLSKLTNSIGCSLLDVKVNSTNDIYSYFDSYNQEINVGHVADDIFIPPKKELNVFQKLKAIIIGNGDNELEVKENSYKKNILMNELLVDGNGIKTNFASMIKNISSNVIRSSIASCISKRNKQKAILDRNNSICEKDDDSALTEEEINICDYTRELHGSYNYNYDSIYYIFPVGDRGSQEMLQGLINSKGNISTILLANFLSSGSRKEKEMVKVYLKDNFDKIDAFDFSVISAVLKDNLNEVEYLFDLAKSRNEYTAIQVFNSIANENIKYAENLFEKNARKNDSILKKGMLAILIRNKSIMALKYVDKLFTGRSPRVVRLFRSDYLYAGSKPLEEYKEISQHDYLQTGKEFPPVYCNAPLPNEVERWEKYIASYPWFPSTDDAYYRLIYRLILDGDIEKAKYFIKEYEKSEFSDTDADYFIKYLKNRIDRNDFRGFEPGIINCNVR